MNTLKLIRPLSLLSIFMISTIAGIANAQDEAPMRTSINDLIPAQDVYCDGTYTLVSTTDISAGNSNLHLCPRIPESGTLTSVPEAVVDWVLVELRAVTHGGTAGNTNANAAVGSTVIARKPAFLLNNGRVVDAELYLEATTKDPTPCTALTAHDNCPDVVFDEGDVATEVSTKDLYIVIRHRNHVDIISSMHVAEAESGVYVYDFSDVVTKARGGSGSLKSKSGVFAMFGGDADGDGNIALSDFNTQIGPNDGAATYLASDADMDTNTDLGDFNRLTNANDGVGIQVP